MKKSEMKQKEKGRKNFRALRGLRRLSIYFEPIRGKFFQPEYPDKIKKSNGDALKPIHPHYAGQIPVFAHCDKDCRNIRK